MREKLKFDTDYDEPFNLSSEEEFSKVTSYTINAPAGSGYRQNSEHRMISETWVGILPRRAK